MLVWPLFVCLQLHQWSRAPLEKYTAPKPLQSLSSNFHLTNLSWHIVKASLRQDHPSHLHTFPRKSFYKMKKTGMNGEVFFTGRACPKLYGAGRGTYCIYQLIEIICYSRGQRNLTGVYKIMFWGISIPMKSSSNFFKKNSPFEPI